MPIDYNCLGQSLDSSWGRSSTPKTASYSVKFKLQGDRLTAMYAAVVNFASEKRMIDMKRTYADESVEVINQVLKNVKANYKELSGESLSAKEVSADDSLEIINLGVHNPKRTALFRKNVTYELA